MNFPKYSLIFVSFSFILLCLLSAGAQKDEKKPPDEKIVFAEPQIINSELDSRAQKLAYYCRIGDEAGARRLFEFMFPRAQQSLRKNESGYYVFSINFNDIPDEFKNDQIRLEWLFGDTPVMNSSDHEKRPTLEARAGVTGMPDLYVAAERWLGTLQAEGIRVRRSPDHGQTWPSTYDATILGAYPLAFPKMTQIGLDYMGIVFTSQRSPTDHDIYFARVNCTNFDSITVSALDSRPLHHTLPAVACNYLDYPLEHVIYVIYYEISGLTSKLILSLSIDNGMTWSFPMQIAEFSTPRKPCCSIDCKDNLVYIAYTYNQGSSDGIAVMKSTSFGVTWGGYAAIATSSVNESYPVIAVKNWNSVFVIYERQASSTDRDIYYAYTSNGGTNWMTNNALASSTADERYPTIRAFKPASYPNDIQAAYELLPENQIIIRSASYLSPTIWTSPLNVKDSDRELSADYGLALAQKYDPDGGLGASLAWVETDESTNDDVYFDAEWLTTITYTLSLTKAGTGGGHVKVNGTLKSLPYSQVFPTGTTVNLEAVPDQDATFTGWSGDLTGRANPTTLIVNRNKTVTANFSLITHTLSISKSGTGSGQVKVNGILHTLPYSQVFPHETIVNLEAIPTVGAFTGWSGDLTGTANPTIITMSSNKSIRANFYIFYTLSLAKQGTGSGLVKVNGTLRTLPYNESFIGGASVSLEAVPDAGSSFKGWGGDLSGTANPTEILLSGNKNVLVAFSVSGLDFLGTWDGQGVYYRNSETGRWIKLASAANLITAGDLDGDTKDDPICIFPSPAGVWAGSSSTGKWTKLSSSSARHIASGDMNGDSREDFLGTWDGLGVFYRNSLSGAWVKMAAPANLLAAGDLDGDTKDDPICIFPSPAGVWVRNSQAGTWAKLSSPSARDIASGDMNGDGREDFLGTWDGLGVFYRNSLSGAWAKMASPAEQVTCGDLDGDGMDDLIGLWPASGGIFVKYSKTGTWAKLSSPARDIATGQMRGGVWGSTNFGFIELQGPEGGHAEGPLSLSGFRDMADEGPGGRRFAPQEEKNLFPQAASRVLTTSGPGDPGFQCLEQANLFPQDQGTAVRKKEKQERKKTNTEKHR
jgi:hypothetical protein